MPSITHEGPIEIIRQHPKLTTELVRHATGIEIPGDDEVEVTLGSTDASNVVPAEFTADMVTLVTDKATSKPLLLVVVEPQGRSEEEKTFSWPAYLTNLRRAHQCKNAVLIVICWNEAEAEKCRQAIPMGHPGFVLAPIVVGPRSAPDLDGASPWLIILCAAIGAIRLGTDDARRTVLGAITATGSNTTDIRRLTTIIMAAASETARLELEALMETAEYKSDFFDRIEAQGEARGEARGEAKGEARALLKILTSRGIDLTDEQHKMLTTCTDLERIDQWLDLALTATSAGDVFKD
jgi:hypothetical protein